MSWGFEKRGKKGIGGQGVTPAHTISLPTGLWHGKKELKQPSCWKTAGEAVPEGKV